MKKDICKCMVSAAHSESVRNGSVTVITGDGEVLSGITTTSMNDPNTLVLKDSITDISHIICGKEIRCVVQDDAE